MELLVGVDGAGDDEMLVEVYRWLARDPELAHRARLTLVPAPPESGRMGGAFEVINVVLTDGIGLGGLVTAILSYRHSLRQSRPKGVVRLERDGLVVTIEPGADVTEIVKALSDRSGPEGS